MTTNPPKFDAAQYKTTTLQQFEVNGQFEGPCEMLVAVASR